jgi:molybdenum cofactor cytidylyltransferase
MRLPRQLDAVTAQPVVIVLASGRGERFRASGGAASKLQAMLAGRAVLERTLAAVRASGLPWRLEDAGHPGMGDAIAAGVRATAGSPAWLILPGDLPLIQASTLRHIATAPVELDVVVPLVHGQRGHPVRFSARCGPELMRLKGEHGAAALVRARGAAEWLLDDIGCIFDIDTLQDLQQAERLLAMRNGADERVR